MAQLPPQTPPGTYQRAVETKKEVPDELAEIVTRSLKIGASTGACGVLFGATAGIVRGTTPVLFSLVSGIQWFGLGSVYYGTRSMALARHGPGYQVTPFQKVEASALGGAIAGFTIAGLTRGRKNVLPAGLVFSILGAGGQFALNKWPASVGASTEGNKSSWLDSRWSPMKKLTDEEYEHILEEKLLRLDAEIAVIDDNIADLKAQKEGVARNSQNQTARTGSRVEEP